MTALEDDQIRLVSIHGTDEDGKLALSREHLRYLPVHNADENTETQPQPNTAVNLTYIALSYAWGNSIETIECDHVEFRVSANLTPALRRLHRHFPGRLIWTDTLSIDQKNPHEKTYQIGVMDRIFATAHTVAVWLGTELAHAYDQLKVYAAQNPPDLEQRDSRISLLRTFSRCQWFYRAWTFQEIRLATNAVVLFDDHMVPWQEFIRTLLVVHSFEPHVSTSTIRSLPRSQSKFTWAKKDRFLGMLDELNATKPHDFASLLYLTWYREAMEKHDKVYSLLGTKLTTSSDLGITIDYRLPWSTLCIQTARAAINLGQHLKILRIAGMTLRWKTPMTNTWNRNELQELLNHPSWAPDWSCPPQQPRSLSSLQYEQRGIFEKLDFCCPSEPPLQSMQDLSPFLVLGGVLLGIINTSHQPTYPGGSTLVHPPPPCSNMISDAAVSPEDDSIMIPEVSTHFLSRAIDSHLQGKCICHGVHRSALPPRPTPPGSTSPFAIEKLHFSNECFHLQSSAPLDALDEDEYPAQVIADSVESGDWLVLLEGGGVPFIVRPAKNIHGTLKSSNDFAGFPREESLPLGAGVFVLVGEASMMWDQVWPGRWSRYCRVGRFVLV